jgi:hypothetical protein
LLVFPAMPDHDRKQIGWSIDQAALRFSVSVRE